MLKISPFNKNWGWGKISSRHDGKQKCPKAGPSCSHDAWEQPLSHRGPPRPHYCRLFATCSFTHLLTKGSTTQQLSVFMNFCRYRSGKRYLFENAYPAVAEPTTFHSSTYLFLLSPSFSSRENYDRYLKFVQGAAVPLKRLQKATHLLYPFIMSSMGNSQADY